MFNKNKTIIFKKHMFADFEVYNNTWTITIFDETSEMPVFRTWGDRVALMDFICRNRDNYIFIFYNGDRYDRHILKAIWYGKSPSEVKDLSDFMINGGQPSYHPTLAFKKNLEIGLFDAYPCVGISLKEVEANLGLEVIRENEGFARDVITEEDKRRIEAYNDHDAITLRKLFYDLKIDKYTFEPRNIIIELYNLPLSYWYKTMPSITAQILGATKLEKQDEFWSFKRPKCLKFLDDSVICEIENTSIEANSKPNWKTYIKNVKFDIKVGGLHGSVKNYVLNVEEDDEYAILVIDVASMYGALMANRDNEEFRIYPRTLRSWEDLALIKDVRLDAKKQKSIIASGLKLPLVSAFGISGCSNLPSYDWSHNRHVCILGQCCLMDMLQHLSNSVEEFIEADTDGIYAKIRKDKIPEVLKIIKEFEDRVSLAFEIEIIKSGLIILDNIHDYIIMSESESTVSIYDNEEKLIKFGVKAKGKYKYYEGPNATHCDYPCVVKAVVDYIAYKVPINVTFEKLIQEEKFLWFAKVVGLRSSHYTTLIWNNKEIGKLARTFAVTNKNHSQLKKKKVMINPETKEEIITYEKPSNMSEHTFVYNKNMNGFKSEKITLDLDHYCNLAIKLVKEKKF